MGVKTFLMKKALKMQLKKLPPEQREIIETLLDENPELFERMTKELENLKKQGKGDMASMMEVMRKFQGELQELLLKKFNPGKGGRPPFIR